jgi:hypothetical protein
MMIASSGATLTIEHRPLRPVLYAERQPCCTHGRAGTLGAFAFPGDPQSGLAVGCFDGGGHDLGAPPEGLGRGALYVYALWRMWGLTENPTVASATFKASLGPEWALRQERGRP